jgi:hypothetical protein
MTPNAQSLSGLSNATPAPVDRAKQLAAILLSERGEASGAQVARELHQMLRLLDASGTASSAISRRSFSPTKRHCARQRSVISPTPRQKARPRSCRLPIHPGRRCCGA